MFLYSAGKWIMGGVLREGEINLYDIVIMAYQMGLLYLFGLEQKPVIYNLTQPIFPPFCLFIMSLLVHTMNQ